MYTNSNSFSGRNTRKLKNKAQKENQQQQINVQETLKTGISAGTKGLRAVHDMNHIFYGVGSYSSSSFLFNNLNKQ